MKRLSLLLMAISLTSCAGKATQECIVEDCAPSVVISGHYSETLKNDSDTMRRAAEIQSVISREMEGCY